MRRREFLALLGGATTMRPLSGRAQQGKLARIGVLVLTSADAQSLGRALREGLRELGYAEGQNFTFEYRSAEGNPDLLPALAMELIPAGRRDCGDLHAVCVGGETGYPDDSDRHGGRC
jgi:putative tryptophan/tyrosine transport system substrate-binding protein